MDARPSVARRAFYNFLIADVACSLVRAECWSWRPDEFVANPAKMMAVASAAHAVLVSIGPPSDQIDAPADLAIVKNLRIPAAEAHAAPPIDHMSF